MKAKEKMTKEEESKRMEERSGEDRPHPLYQEELMTDEKKSLQSAAPLTLSCEERQRKAEKKQSV
jgi:hypothetical protein